MSDRHTDEDRWEEICKLKQEIEELEAEADDLTSEAATKRQELEDLGGEAP